MNHTTNYMYKDLVRVSPLQKRIEYIVVDNILTARTKGYTFEMLYRFLASDLKRFMRERTDLYKHLVHSAYILHPTWINWQHIAEALVVYILEKRQVGGFFNEETKKVAMMVHDKTIAENFKDLLSRRRFFRDAKLGHILFCYKAVGFGCNNYSCWVDNRLVDWVGAARYFRKVVHG